MFTLTVWQKRIDLEWFRFISAKIELKTEISVKIKYIF